MGIKFFLDTNVYDNLNYSFNNRQLSKVKDLVLNDEIELLYNEIVYKEVVQHITENVGPAVNQYNQFLLESRALAPFKNYDDMCVKLSPLDSDKMISELQNNWDSYLKDCYAEEINIDTVDINDIVDRYFRKRPPFETKKPYEFKDAIIIDSLRQYSFENPDDQIYVVSHDKGFRKSFKEDLNIIAFSDLYKAINQAISIDENISVEISNLFNNEVFIEHLKSCCDDILYYEDVSVADVFDGVDVISANCINLEFLYLDSTEANDSTLKASIVVSADINYVVEFQERDEDQSYYDKEDQKYYWEVYNTYKNTYVTQKELVLTIDFDTENTNLDNAFTCSEVYANEPFYLEEFEIIKSELLNTTGDEEPVTSHYAQDSLHTTCPDCGCELTIRNSKDGFCINCAVNH